MILSVSRRTDIPALYGRWFVNRLRAGEVLVPDLYRAGGGIRLLFDPGEIDCIVYWTKNPVPFLPLLDEAEALGYGRCRFSYTITAFGKEMEPGLPPLEARLQAFEAMSRRLGPRRVDWRFDPIVLDGARGPAWYGEKFAALCERLSPLTRRCILSFVDPYPHLRGRFPPAAREAMEETGARLAETADKFGLPLVTCAEAGDFSRWGIRHGACVDRKGVEEAAGYSVEGKHHRGQRGDCGCVESFDVGVYDTCVNGCAYCYATKSPARAQARFAAHDPASPLLTGWPEKGWIWREKSAVTLGSGQRTFGEMEKERDGREETL